MFLHWPKAQAWYAFTRKIIIFFYRCCYHCWCWGFNRQQQQQQQQQQQWENSNYKQKSRFILKLINEFDGSHIMNELNSTDFSDRCGLNECSLKCIFISFLKSHTSNYTASIFGSSIPGIIIKSEFPLCKDKYLHRIKTFSPYMKQSERYNRFADLIIFTKDSAIIVEFKYIRLSEIYVNTTVNKSDTASGNGKNKKKSSCHWRPSILKKIKRIDNIWNGDLLVSNPFENDNSNSNTNTQTLQQRLHHRENIKLSAYCDHVNTLQLSDYVRSYKKCSGKLGIYWKYTRKNVFSAVIIGAGNKTFSKCY